MAMLKQEETFREQVNELHRLYRVQKLLMRDAADLHAGRHHSPRDHHHHRPRRPPQPAMLDLELPAADDDGACDDDDPDADVELTLATGGNAWTGGARRKKADSSDSASGASFSSSTSTESGSGGSASGGESLDVRDWGLWYRAPTVEAQRPVAVAVHQGRPQQRPSWQMQYLSLNMT